jgi:hypothetical protein
MVARWAYLFLVGLRSGADVAQETTCVAGNPARKGCKRLTDRQLSPVLQTDSRGVADRRWRSPLVEAGLRHSSAIADLRKPT